MSSKEIEMADKRESAKLGKVSVDGVNGESLVSIVKRIERLTQEKAALSDDIAAIYAAAKAEGFEVKAIRELIKRRAQDEESLQEMEVLVQLYKEAVDNAPFDAGHVVDSLSFAGE